MKNKVIVSLVFLSTLLAVNGLVLADGTETLGPPSIAIQSGSGIAIGGVGLAQSQPGDINVSVPAGATVKQVILYWSGYFSNDPGAAADTMAITVNALPVVGTKIGGPTYFFAGAYATTYRADITSLALVTAGDNSLSVGGLSFTDTNHGAGVLVIFDDGLSSSIELRDGTDTAFINFPEPRQTTVEQTFLFAPAAVMRTAELAIFTGSVAGSDLAGPRPNVIQVTVGAAPPILFIDELNSNDGREWDSVLLPVDIPADVNTVKVQLISADPCSTGNLPASFVWVGAGLSVPTPQDQCNGIIGDFVWYDCNCDGIQDTNEPGIPGISVWLLNADGNSIASTVTDANGLYMFTGLCAGTYKVKVNPTSLPYGAVPTIPLVGSDPAVDSNPCPATVVLENNSDIDLTIDFGFCRFRPICGLTIGFWKTNAAKDLGIQKGKAQVSLTKYYELLGCVVDSFSADVNDWSQWGITKPINGTDLKYALKWLAYGAYDPATGKTKPEASDPMVKARGQLLALMLTSCYKDGYADAMIWLPGYNEVKTIDDWTIEAIDEYNKGCYAAAQMIAVYINENCAMTPICCIK